MIKSIEEKREYAREYYRNNRIKIQNQTKARYVKNQGERRHIKRFLGKRCLLCDIRLDGPYGAKRTISYCSTCSKDMRLRSRIRCRKYYHKKHHGIILSTQEIIEKITA